MYVRFIKPLVDCILSFFLLIVFSPLLLLISSILFYENKGGILFVQKRPGLNGKPFVIIKFKTMIDAYDDEGNLFPDHIRLTKTGKLVRGLSIDELLQLVNVIKGDMSLVGPRPLMMQYLSRYDPGQAKRHNVKPGITGWAQVNGRNTISWEEKFRLDVEYVETQSFWLDMKIIAMTIKNVIQRKGISSDDHATMEEFMGKE